MTPVPRQSLNKIAPRMSHIRNILFAALAIGVLLTSTLGLVPAPVGASEAEIDMTNPQQARSLRLGLQKSAVLKLPTAVKDVIVGNPGLVDVVLKNRNTAYLFARQAGQTNVFFLDASGQQILQLDLEVTVDTKALKALLERSLPGSAITVDSTGSNIVLKGTVADAQQGKTAQDLAERFISTYGGTTSGTSTPVLNLLKIAEGNQVMLKVRVVELKRTVLKQLGINLDGSITAGTFKFDWKNTTYADTDSKILDGTGVIPGITGAPVNITATIRALESNGLATVLADRTLTAVSGAPASFHAGGEYPYSSCTRNTTTQLLDCSLVFQPYGITLDFTPTVLSQGRIALNIFTEVSDLAVNPYQSNGQPVIDLRNAQTSIELPSGGSMMLAGLIKNVSLQQIDNTPGLRSLPILGALFSSQSFQRNQSELVVLVTPYIVGATNADDLATPIDHYNNATDLQQLFLGRLNKVYGPPGSGAAPSGAYHGDIGHIIE